MAQIRHILPLQPRVAFADKLHIAVDVLEDKIKLFGINMAINAREGDGEFCLGGGVVVGDIAVEVRPVQGAPEAFGFRAGGIDTYDGRLLISDSLLDFRPLSFRLT